MLFPPTGWLPAASHGSSAAAKGTGCGRDARAPRRCRPGGAVGGVWRATSQKAVSMGLRPRLNAAAAFAAYWNPWAGARGFSFKILSPPQCRGFGESSLRSLDQTPPTRLPFGHRRPVTRRAADPRWNRTPGPRAAPPSSSRYGIPPPDGKPPKPEPLASRACRECERPWPPRFHQAHGPQRRGQRLAVVAEGDRNRCSRRRIARHAVDVGRFTVHPLDGRAVAVFGHSETRSVPVGFVRQVPDVDAGDPGTLAISRSVVIVFAADDIGVHAGPANVLADPVHHQQIDGFKGQTRHPLPG